MQLARPTLPAASTNATAPNRKKKLAKKCIWALEHWGAALHIPSKVRISKLALFPLAVRARLICFYNSQKQKFLCSSEITFKEELQSFRQKYFRNSFNKKHVQYQICLKQNRKDQNPLILNQTLKILMWFEFRRVHKLLVLRTFEK